MTDLYKSYPDSSLPLLEEYEELMSSFHRIGLTTADLLTLEPVFIAQMCERSAVEVRQFLKRLETDVYASLVLESAKGNGNSDEFLTTGDEGIDQVLGGGIPIGCITEVSGESASGKSHLLLQLAATVQLPTELGGLNKSAIYISTESGGLETRRLHDIIDGINERHAEKNNMPLVSGNNVRCYNCFDNEELLHIMQYQLPIAIEKHSVGLLLIDSIAAHYRAEVSNIRDESDALARTQSLITIARIIRTLASRYKLAVVVANQVADRFSRSLGKDTQLDPFMFDHQLRWYSGWTNESIEQPQQLNLNNSKSSQGATQAFSIFESFDSKTDASELMNSFISAEEALSLEAEVTAGDKSSPHDEGVTASQYASGSTSSKKTTELSMSQTSESSTSSHDFYKANDYGKVPALGVLWANEVEERIV